MSSAPRPVPGDLLSPAGPYPFRRFVCTLFRVVSLSSASNLWLLRPLGSLDWPGPAPTSLRLTLPATRLHVPKRVDRHWITHTSQRNLHEGLAAKYGSSSCLEPSWFTKGQATCTRCRSRASLPLSHSTFNAWTLRTSHACPFARRKRIEMTPGRERPCPSPIFFSQPQRWRRRSTSCNIRATQGLRLDQP